MGPQEVLDGEKELAGLGAQGQPPAKAKEGGSERDKAREGSRRRPQTKARADPGCRGQHPSQGPGASGGKGSRTRRKHGPLRRKGPGVAA